MKLKIKKLYKGAEKAQVVDFLAENCELSKIKIKNAIGMGSLWIRVNNAKSKKRVKKIKTTVQRGDFIEFNYDDSLSFEAEKDAFELYKGKEFGVWYKPAGLLSDGTPFSDRGSISYLVKQSGKKCFLIQRLDREVAGLMLVAYSKKTASFYSKELLNNKISKYYQAIVLGAMEEKDGKIDLKLDGKEALTTYSVFKREEDVSCVDIEIHTGRYHQIRRHFDAVGNPIMGDPKYGSGNKNKDGLKLVASGTEFFDYTKRKRIELNLDEKYCLF